MYLGSPGTGTGRSAEAVLWNSAGQSRELKDTPGSGYTRVSEDLRKTGNRGAAEKSRPSLRLKRWASSGGQWGRPFSLWKMLILICFYLTNINNKC